MQTDQKVQKPQRTQKYCDHVNDLREYEEAHRQWMTTPRFSSYYPTAKLLLDTTRDTYVKAVKAHELEQGRDTIVM